MATEIQISTMYSSILVPFHVTNTVPVEMFSKRHNTKVRSFSDFIPYQLSHTVPNYSNMQFNNSRHKEDENGWMGHLYSIDFKTLMYFLEQILLLISNVQKEITVQVKDNKTSRHVDL